MTLQHRRQRSGQTGQSAVIALMRTMGFKCIEEVHTGMKMAGMVNGKPRYVYAKKVSGDIRAVGLDGKSVLVEVKRRVKGNLTHSDLEPHQHAALTDHWNAGGISLLAWVSDKGVIIMFWNRITYLSEPRASMTWEQAQEKRIA